MTKKNEGSKKDPKKGEGVVRSDQIPPRPPIQGQKENEKKKEEDE